MEKKLKKTILIQNNYDEKDLLESKINHRIKRLTHFIYIIIHMIRITYKE